MSLGATLTGLSAGMVGRMHWREGAAPRRGPFE